MFTSNPCAELSASIPTVVMQGYIVLMVLLVIGGTILDMMHKKSAQYFFENAKKAKKSAKLPVGAGEKVSIAASVLVNEVLTSGEFNNTRRRLSHLLTMYGFIIFVVTTAIMIFGYPTPATPTPALLPQLWHIGALMLAIGGYWFWSFTGGGLTIFFALFILSSTVLFGGVYFSKFAHMFFKPAAAYQKKITRADGSRENLPPDYDLTDPEVQRKFPDIPMYMGKNPPNMGLCIKAERANHY